MLSAARTGWWLREKRAERGQAGAGADEEDMEEVDEDGEEVDGGGVVV